MTQQAADEPILIEDGASTAPEDRSPRDRSSGLSLGFFAKICFLGIINASAIWALPTLIGDGVWLAVAFLVFATVAIDVVYLSRARWALPLKYLLPGTLFLLVFQVYPVLYTGYISLTNLGTGNILDKSEAIDQIERQSLSSTPSNTSFVASGATNADGTVGLILATVDENDEVVEVQIGTADGVTPVDLGDVTFREGSNRIESAGGFNALGLREANDLGDELTRLIVPTDEGVIRLTTASRAALVQFALSYDPATDTMTNVETGVVYSPLEGNFVSDTGERLTPGWQATIGFDNYQRVFQSEAIRGPFFRVFLWNWAFAAGSVIFSFAVGLGLAITLNHEELKGKRLYRAFLIFPYALPSFLTVLVWEGMLNQRFGVVNEVFGTDIPWLSNAWVARGSILLVNTWLGFPYMFLVATGALQSVPDELKEAANVDGANAFQAFRRVTFPLLMIPLAPLLISSFAFNFNNFNVVSFLTRGGPPVLGAQTPAGSTDILVSYTYNLAFASGRGQGLAFATAISILIFIHIALFSAASFRKTAKLEDI